MKARLLHWGWLLVAWGIGGMAAGETYYCDPVKGSAKNAGSAEAPWGALEEVIKRGLVEKRDVEGRLLNAGAVVKAGDTVLLRSGFHGKISIREGHNAEFITFAAEPGHKADLSHVSIGGGCRWRIRGLRISPSLAPKPPEKAVRHLVQLGEHGKEGCSELVVEDCFIFSVPDVSSWTATDWVKKPTSGIWLGRHGRGHVARNNYILNTRMGIDLCATESLCEGNVIDGFSGDGIRVTRDGIVVRHNVIKNNYVSDADGDRNHDDGIQCFLFNKGRGLVRDVTIEGNLIMQRETAGGGLVNPLQGIGFFDGPLVDFVVKDNAVEVDHHHGVSIYDGQGCRLIGNACYNPDAASKRKPWVMLGQKRNLAKGNTVEGNFAHSFNFKADPDVEATGNVKVDAASFRKKRAQVLGQIVERFGDRHSLAGKPRAH